MMPYPALFIGHGNPLHALAQSENSRAWRDMIDDLPRPRAILCISAHWLTRGVAVTATANPETIHDFSGFPPALHALRYPAPGNPMLADEITALLAPQAVTQDTERGLDHGAWSVLTHLYPDAGIPVLQLALDLRMSAAEHYALAAKLQPLRDTGVLILGSGNIVHNLRRIDWQQPERGFDWAVRFQQGVRHHLAARLHTALFDTSGPDAALAVPTPDHYWPLLYIAAQQRAGEVVTFFNDRIEYGSIGMLSCRVGMSTPSAS
jgi:4,5-DOPA dioxygenase extradiol